mgnify:CR=1 FL=1
MRHEYGRRLDTSQQTESSSTRAGLDKPTNNFQNAVLLTVALSMTAAYVLFMCICTRIGNRLVDLVARTQLVVGTF